MYTGRNNALKLFIDTNRDREIMAVENITDTLETDKIISPKVSKSITDSDDSVRIQIQTVEPYTSYGGGQYVVTSVKQMSSTPDFDNFPEYMKKCQDKESIEECSNRKLMIGAANECGCLPQIINQFQTALKV